MNFVILDISLLVLFVLAASFFLYRNRENLKKEGALLLYKTSWGIKFINYVGEKYQKTLKIFSYISITTGYFLMAGVILLMFQTVYLYLTSEISQVIKAPPLAPLIPYFPKLFGLQSFFPPFYFIYFIVAILIVATVHEFAHGIFAKRYGVKIKSTGFAFLKYFPAFFGAFVEQDDAQMNKRKKFEQMGILSGGVFANVIVGVLFYFVLFAFFQLAFIPVGVQFSTYSYSAVDVGGISSINNLSVNSYQEILSYANEDGLNKIISEGKSYIATKDMLEEQKENEGIIILYDDSPAAASQIGSIIAEINGVKIDSLEKLQEEINKYSPGEEINIKTEEVSGDYNIILGENPKDENTPWLGIGFYENENRISKIISKIFPSYKKEYVYYKSGGQMSVFVKDFLWWIFIINILVAFFNMLPLGILDGGRFFYLTIAGITGSEKIAKKSFKIVTILILFIFLALMMKWIVNLF